MKYIIIIVFMLLSTSCRKLSFVELVIENNTEHQLTIEGFFNGKKSDVISIGPFESYTDSQYIDFVGGPYLQLFEEYLIDSVNIIFDSNRVIVQSCEESELAMCIGIENNILDFEVSYEIEYINRNESRYIYKITEEDYARALPLE